MKTKTFIIVIVLILIGLTIMAGIHHKAVKAHGETGLASEWNDNHEMTANFDVEQYQFLNNVIENRTDWPAGPIEGQIIYRTDLNAVYVYDGTGWSLSNKRINYWSCPGFAFRWLDNDGTRAGGDPSDGSLWINTNTTYCGIGIQGLPNGATITSCIVYGNIADETWELKRVTLSSGAILAMGNENFNTEDNTIANAVVDNNQYGYIIHTSGLDDGDKIHGARITYTL